MIRNWWLTLALATAPLPAAAGPIAVFTQVSQQPRGTDEIPLTGLGTFAVLTTGSSGVNPVITVATDQASASQSVVGFWPVIQFQDHAQYEAQQGTVLTVPDTPVKLYTEIHDGAYGQASSVKQVFFDATVSGQVSATPGLNRVDWRFANSTQQVTFDDAVVTVSFEPKTMPDGIPQIQFADGSPMLGAPGTPYYPTLLEARIQVDRTPTDPNGGNGDGGGDTGGGGTPQVPEPTTAVLVAACVIGGWVLRRRG
ncbi:MAG: hypothetical protein ABGY75_00745 [Gemmataceae bacterium]